jgi:hypothetical protein
MITRPDLLARTIPFGITNSVFVVPEPPTSRAPAKEVPTKFALCPQSVRKLPGAGRRVAIARLIEAALPVDRQTFVVVREETIEELVRLVEVPSPAFAGPFAGDEDVRRAEGGSAIHPVGAVHPSAPFIPSMPSSVPSGPVMPLVPLVPLLPGAPLCPVSP